MYSSSADRCLICYNFNQSKNSSSQNPEDSKSIFEIYCRYFNIKLSGPLNWDFEKENLPFCSICLDSVKRVSDYHSEIQSLQSKIKNVLQNTKIHILKSRQAHCQRIGNESIRRAISRIAFEKVNIFRNLAVKEFDPDVEIWKQNVFFQPNYTPHSEKSNKKSLVLLLQNPFNDSTLAENNQIESERDEEEQEETETCDNSIQPYEPEYKSLIENNIFEKKSGQDSYYNSTEILIKSNDSFFNVGAVETEEVDPFFELQEEQTTDRIILSPKKMTSEEKKLTLNNAIINNKKKITEGVAYFECRHCRKIFYSRTTCILHSRIHIRKKPYQCKVKNCSKRFSAKGTLKIHARTHTGERPYRCNYTDCPKSYTAPKYLRAHEKTHLQVKQLNKCKYAGCNRTYTMIESLRYHELHHSHEKGRIFTCKLCNKVFDKSNDLALHFDCVHKTQPQPSEANTLPIEQQVEAILNAIYTDEARRNGLIP